MIGPRTFTRSSTSRKEKTEMRISSESDNAGARRRSGIGALCLGLLLAFAMAAAPSAMAGLPEFSLRSGLPDTVEAGQGVRTTITAVNTGSAPFTGTVTITVDFPAGFETGDVEAFSEGATCEALGQRAVCGFEVTELQPLGQVTMWLHAAIAPNVPKGPTPVEIEIDGNGNANDVHATETIAIGPPRPFEVSFFDNRISRAGSPETQAGAAPESVINEFAVPGGVNQLFEFPNPQLGLIVPAENMRTVLVHAPTGMVANLNATPVRCTATELIEQSLTSQLPKCPADSQVGTVRILHKRLMYPIYNMVTPPGMPAAFGFNILNVAVIIEAHLRPDDFGFDLATRNINTAIPLTDIAIELWGVPADASHDTGRGDCVDGGEGNSHYHEPHGICSTNAQRKAFLRLPTSCSGQPLPWDIEMDSYQDRNSFETAHDTTPAQVGCNQLEFTPSLKTRPTTNVGDSPSGLEFALHIPQNEDPDGLAEAQLRDLRAALPEGLTVNPSSADGLGACTPAQIGMVTPVGQSPAHFSGEHANCPASSKLGSVNVFAPDVGHNLPGLVYLAEPHRNPFGSLFALYLAIDDPQSGIIVKVPVKVETDAATGRLTTVVEESAPLPFEDFEVELDQGPHAALRTPLACGDYSTTSTMTPWSAPEGQDAHPADSFTIVKGAGGGACVPSESGAPAVPSFEGGTLEPRAGIYSPFVLKLTRQDGSQQMTGVSVTLPKGLLARIGSYATYCPEAALAAAAAKSGADEKAHPSCPSSSEVGNAYIASGAGPAPLHVQGKIYITGAYKGGSLGLAVITPAVAGPFDLGTVVTRNSVRIDPLTAQVTAVSDRFPQMLQGMPLDVRQVLLSLDKPNYTINPTSCDPMAVTGTVSLLSGQSAAVSNPFQVGGCANLGFKPKLSLSLKGGTKRTKHPALTATVAFPNGASANIARAAVSLPHSEFLDQSHIGTVCTRVQFAADTCPAQSVYGTARALTPLLEQPLEGQVYLRSSSHELPDLVAALRGQIDVDLVGRVDSAKGGIRTTFESVPDAPITKFTLALKGGKKGLLQNSTNICRGNHRALVLLDGQNGKTADQKPALKARCSSARHRKRR